MRKRNIVILVFFSAAVALVLLLPKPKAAGTAGGSGGVPAAPADPSGNRGGRPASAAAFSVRTEPVLRGTLQDYIETNGDVVSDSAVKVYPYIAGRLVSLKVPLGGRISKGEVLAEVDPSTPGSAFSLNPVLAPISGTVISLPVAVGSLVGTGTALAELGAIEDVQVEARVPERFVGVLRTGLRASVSLEAYPGFSFPAAVVRVSPVVDPVSRTKTIRLGFDRLDARINPGMFARIRLNTLAYPDRLLVGESALRSDAEGSFVFVVREGTASKRRVVLGAAVDGRVEVVSGLEEGETVVIEGAAALADGAAVRDIGTRGGERP